MAARKTEQGLPAGFTAVDLGQATSDPAAALISFHSSPVVAGRTQTYVAFALDTSLQTDVAFYRWQAGTETTETETGVFEIVPESEGDLQISVSLLDSGGATLKSLTLDQSVVALNSELESMIDSASDGSPVAADPETSRELVNDVRGYIDELAPRSADPESSLNRLLFALAYAEAMRIPPGDRSRQTEQAAEALGQSALECFADQSESGLGLCQLRPQVVAMYLSATQGGSDWLISQREFPANQDDRPAARKSLKAEFAELDEQRLIDLFNLLRFPKSNLKIASLVAQSLMAQYFSTESLPAILADDGKAHILINQFKEGPFALA